MKESELVKRISDYLKTVPSLFFGRNTAVCTAQREYPI